MKIVLCNKFFFLNGGTERYLRTCLDEFPKLGHQAVPFSVNYAGSWESPYSSYFLPAPGDPGQIHFERIKLKPSFLPSFIGRSVYSFEAKRLLGNLLEALGGADIGYILNIYNYMSPSVIDAFKSRKIPVVVRFGDYNAICPNYQLLRAGKPCTLCVPGDYYHGLLHRCVKGSFAVSGLRVFSMYVQKFLGLYQKADAVVAPCNFMREKLIEGGFAPAKVRVIPQPAPPDNFYEPTPKGDYILYFGRLSQEKGLDTLIEAYQEANPDVDLVLAGRSYGSCRADLEKLVRPDFAERIRFTDFLSGRELSRLVAGAQLSLAPSRWYDNAPLAVFESYMAATPVLAANIGGIPEQVIPGETGFLFEPDNITDLALKLRQALSDRTRLAKMGERARDFVKNERGLDRHLESLFSLFGELLG